MGDDGKVLVWVDRMGFGLGGHSGHTNGLVCLTLVGRKLVCWLNKKKLRRCGVYRAYRQGGDYEWHRRDMTTLVHAILHSLTLCSQFNALTLCFVRIALASL